MKYLFLVLFFSLACQAQWCRFNGHIEDGKAVINVHLQKNSHVYKDAIMVVSETNPVTGIRFSEEPEQENEMSVFKRSFDIICTLNRTPTLPFAVDVVYEGCHGDTCFLPQTVHLIFTETGVSSLTDSMKSHLPPELAGFREIARFTGYQTAAKTLTWCQTAGNTPTEHEHSLLDRTRASWGILAVIVLVLMMGISLNLTPCVLPMIPVNLAIICGSKQTKSRRQRIAAALLYALGMALAYGALGVITLKTGSQFGNLNTHWLFNGCAALVFLILGLAMLDVFAIDLSRWRRTVHATSGISILVLGIMTALLSGACVAPVLISVLLFAAQIYSEGISWAMGLPFALGIGMALPWPLLAAGLASLPRPGHWMLRVRQILAAAIFCLALWYGWNTVALFKGSEYHARDGWFTEVPLAVEDAMQNKRMLLIEFYGSSCKACVMMNAVFKNKDIEQAIAPWSKLSLNAENTPAMAQGLNVVGVPTYILFTTDNGQPRE